MNNNSHEKTQGENKLMVVTSLVLISCFSFKPGHKYKWDF